MAKSKTDFFNIKREERSNRNVFNLEHKDMHASELKNDYSETDAYINKKLDEANESFTKLENKVEQIERSTKSKIDKELSDLRLRIDESKSRVVETLALFAALFTFLSLQVQIFKEQTDVDQVLGLVLITGGLITFFVLILDLMIKNKDDAKNFLRIRFFLLLSISVLLIACGILMMKLDI